MPANTAFTVLLQDHRELNVKEMVTTVGELVTLIENEDTAFSVIDRFNEYVAYKEGLPNANAFETYRLAANLWIAMNNYGRAQGILRTEPKPPTTVELRQLIGSLTGAWMGDEMQNKLAHHDICQMEQFMALDRNYMWDIMKLSMGEMALIEGFQAKLESVS